jgi:nicotinic acid mononucleotide adenylyltransferase
MAHMRLLDREPSAIITVAGSEKKIYQDGQIFINDGDNFEIRFFNPLQYEFAFIMGQDNANTFHKWVNYEHLEKMMKFVVIPRKGVERDLSIDWYLNKPHIFLHDEETNIMDVSSTLVRNLLKDIYENGYTSDKETELQKYLNKDVISYILENKLYKRIYKTYV